MKKFIIIFIILLIFSGVIFYFGWVQIQIPPNSVAVIHTKTSGFDKNVTKSGDFSWRIEKLIPTNMTIYIFNIEPVFQDVQEIKGSLPSADIYSTMLPGNPNFDYTLNISVSLSIDIETLPLLVAEHGLKPDNLSQWFEEKSGIISQQIFSYVKNNPSLVYDEEYIERITNQLTGLDSLYGVIINNVYINNVEFPDLDLYYAAKQMYLDLQEAHQIQDIDSINAEKNNILILEEYGELLTKYPILLKYLYLNQLSKEELIDEILDLNFDKLLQAGE